MVVEKKLFFKERKKGMSGGGKIGKWRMKIEKNNSNNYFKKTMKESGYGRILDLRQ